MGSSGSGLAADSRDPPFATFETSPKKEGEGRVVFVERRVGRSL